MELIFHYDNERTTYFTNDSAEDEQSLKGNFPQADCRTFLDMNAIKLFL